MDIGENVSDSIKYPTTEWPKILILGVILIIPIVNFIGMGYILRIIKATFAGIDDLPDFDEIGELFIDGLKIFIASIAYFIIPMIIIFYGVFTSIYALGSMGNTYAVADPTAVFAVFFGVMGLVILIGMILWIVFAIFFAIAIANMALYEGELGAAFKFSEIMDRISMIGWGKYILWVIVMIIIGIVAGVITSILNVIPIIGWIIGIIVVYPYLYMFYGRSLALIYASSEEGQEAMETETA